MVQQIRKTKLQEIFNKLDSDQDGKISWKSNNIPALSAEIQKVFMPLWNELKILQEPLDKEEFVDAGLRLYSVSY